MRQTVEVVQEGVSVPVVLL